MINYLNKIIRNESNEKLIILFSSIVCYCHSISGDFVFDDSEAILNNNDVVEDTDLKQIFSNDFWGTKMRHNSSHKSYRPLTVLTFRILRHYSFYIRPKSWQSFDSELNPKLYHFLNIILYGFLCLLLLEVMNKLLNIHIYCVDKNDQIVDECSHVLRYKINNNKTAFLVTLLFSVHPIHSESVSACVGLADILSSMVGFVVLLNYTKFSFGHKYFNYVGISCNCIFIVVFSGISMLFKEQGITFIGLCVFFDFMSLMNRQNKSLTQMQIKLLTFRIICLSFGALVLMLLRLMIMDFNGPQFQRVDNPASFEDSFCSRIINYSYIYALNVWIMAYPLWLCFDWSMGCIPLIKNFYDFRIIFVVFFWLTSILFINLSLFHRDSNIRSQLQISLAFGLIPFVPSSNLFFRVGFVIAERALFIPIIGYLLLAMTGFHLLQTRFIHYSKTLQTFVILLAMVFAIRSFRRCYDWNNERELFESGLLVCPLNAKIHYNIAKNAADSGLKMKAISEYREAIRLNPEYDHAMNNLANILKDSGNYEESKVLLLKAIQIRPTFAAAYMNLGIVETALKLYSNAEISYKNALKHKHRYADCLYNLGNLYVQQKRFDEAYIAWRNATLIKPKLLPAWNNLIVMLDNIGAYDRAHKIALEAINFHPNESSIHFNYANVLGKAGKFEESETHFKSAILLNPSKATYYANLAVLYHRWKEYSKALTNYRIALKLDPNLKNAKENMESLKRIINK